MDEPALWLALLSAVVGGFFAANHAALHHYSRRRLEQRLSDAGKLARLSWLIENRRGLVLFTALSRSCFHLLVLIGMLVLFEALARQLQWAALGAAFGAAGVTIAALGVVIPIYWGRYAPQSVLASSLPALRIGYTVFRPLQFVLRFPDSVVRRLLGADSRQSAETHPDQDILDAVSEGEREGLVDEDQKGMIEAVVEFSNAAVEQIMTPRTDVKGIEVHASLDQIKQEIAEAGHSRMPVYEGDLDHIVGVLYAKDLLPLIGTDLGEPIDLRRLVREAIFVPESKPLRDLLEELKEKKVHLALVLDEYGGTAGVVTIEDVLEEIVGEIHDEYEPPVEEPAVTHLEQGVAEADGRVHIDDFNEQMQSRIPEDQDYDTIGGFVFSTIGHIPEMGESFDYEDMRITVIDAEKTRVNRVRIDRLNAEASQPAENGKPAA